MYLTVSILESRVQQGPSIVPRREQEREKIKNQKQKQKRKQKVAVASAKKNMSLPSHPSIILAMPTHPWMTLSCCLPPHHQINLSSRNRAVKKKI